MNTHVDYRSSLAGIPAAAPAVSADEVLVDIPSKHITGHVKRVFDAYTLTQRDMGFIFEELRKMIDHDSCGDVDGVQYDLDYKAFRIEAVHHYQCHEERGGDSYCGGCESYGVTDVDRIEVVRVFDEDGKEYLGWVNKLNYYAKQNNI